MRDAGERFGALIGGVARWITEADVLIDGQWVPVTYLSGEVVSDAGQECRWQVNDLELGNVPAEVSPLGTQLRLRHGIAGLPLLDMGVYKITDLNRPLDETLRVGGAAMSQVTVTGSSHELYVKRDDWPTLRTLQPQSATVALAALIKELLPEAVIQIDVPDADTVQIPRVEADNRWQLIDGKDAAPSIAKALGAVAFCGPSGEWIIAPQPTLADPVSFEVAAGDRGLLLSAAEALSDEGVANRVIVAPDGDQSWPVQVVEDLDPTSPTFIKRPISQGGFGPKTFTYTNSLITNSAQGLTVARAQLASRLGLRQQLSLGLAYDPRLEVGDVGVVHTAQGTRKVILDAVSFDLASAQMTAQTRTTATRYAGESYEIEDGGDGDA